jgi:hypothetical protein
MTRLCSSLQCHGTAWEVPCDPRSDGDVRPRDIDRERLTCIVVLCEGFDPPVCDGRFASVFASLVNRPFSAMSSIQSVGTSLYTADRVVPTVR